MRDPDSFSWSDVGMGIVLLVSCVGLAAGCFGFALVLIGVTT